VINNDAALAQDLGRLPVFVRVADTLSFRAAAQDLGLTAAAVSRTIQRLEESLGVRLFERSTRSVRLTAEGGRFVARCREALAQVRIGAREVAESRSAPTGTLVISASPILARLVVGRLGRFLLRHPAVRLDLRLTDRVVRFADDDVDVALRVGAPTDPSAVAHALVKTRWVTVASPAYVARRGAPRTPADLADHECLRFVPPRGKARPWVFVAQEETGIVTIATSLEVTSALDVDHGDVLVDAALADVGIAQVLYFMVEEHVRAGRLLEVLANAAAPGPTVHAVHPRRPLPRVRAFVDFLAEELGARRPRRAS
jgi:DNA-binding transcriptional LysR family regulator